MLPRTVEVWPKAPVDSRFLETWATLQTGQFAGRAVGCFLEQEHHVGRAEPPRHLLQLQQPSQGRLVCLWNKGIVPGARVCTVEMGGKQCLGQEDHNEAISSISLIKNNLGLSSSAANQSLGSLGRWVFGV